ncbi:MAG: c-type cytochrome [Thermoanaerobaculia bacterium]|nr:c-type cytochrome [Thermoanaerobaculia bacterium]
MRRSLFGPLLLVTLPVLLAGPAGAEAALKRSAAWEASCTPCHGADGRSRTEEGMERRARDLTDAKWQATVSDDRLASSIRRGRGRMPPFGRKLTGAQIRALVEEVRNLARKDP